MAEIEPRLLALEGKVDNLSNKFDKLDNRLSSMSSSIAIIAEKLSNRPSIIPYLILIGLAIFALITV